MENKIYRSKEVVSPEAATDRARGRGQEAASPKFSRKKNDAQPSLGRKMDSRVGANETITFISPKKYLEHPNGGTDSFKARPSIKNFGTVGHSQGNIQANEARPGNSVHNPVEPKLVSSRTFQSAEEIIAKVKASKEAAELKTKTEYLDKKLSESNDKVKNLREENDYLFCKIEQFNTTIAEKNELINQLTAALRDKERQAAASQGETEFLRRKNEELEGVIVLLNKSLEESSKCSCINVTISTDDG
jgi:hypothetical protein